MQHSQRPLAHAQGKPVSGNCAGRLRCPAERDGEIPRSARTPLGMTDFFHGSLSELKLRPADENGCTWRPDTEKRWADPFLGQGGLKLGQYTGNGNPKSSGRDPKTQVHTANPGAAGTKGAKRQRVREETDPPFADGALRSSGQARGRAPSST